MRKLPTHFGLILLLVFLAFLLSACNQKTERDYGEKDFPKKFNEQLEASCAPRKVYWKEVRSDNEDQSGVMQLEKKQLVIDSCGEKGTAKLDGKSMQFNLKDELNYTFRYFYLDPFLLDLFQVQETSTTFTAVLKSDSPEDTQLQYQQIDLNPDNPEKILSVNSIIRSNSLFYFQNVESEITFHPDGTLALAEINMSNTLKLTGRNMVTNIRLYPDSTSSPK